jgi:hypothetical protein
MTCAASEIIARLTAVGGGAAGLCRATQSGRSARDNPRATEGFFRLFFLSDDDVPPRFFAGSHFPRWHRLATALD